MSPESAHEPSGQVKPGFNSKSLSAWPTYSP